jgi:hypothetical protein
VPLKLVFISPAFLHASAVTIQLTPAFSTETALQWIYRNRPYISALNISA